MKTITIGFSPCPNDTFIFDALINGRIKNNHFNFVPLLVDVEQLNSLALQGKLDVTKISIGAFAQVSSHYRILDSGSALGKGVGPLLVKRKDTVVKELKELKVAIPGKNTTANLLLSVFFPEITAKTEMVFSEIEDAVLSGKADAGLLIHEGRFTYEKKDLIKLYDLGEVWEERMNLPLPLGCIAASRKLSLKEMREINTLIRHSIEHANNCPADSVPYINKNATEMDSSVIASHIQLYVNEFSLDLGTEGKNAIEFLLQKGFQEGHLPHYTKPVFVY
jgi:1,4-dihydroxy-6-naphthoate synthase